MPPRSSARSRGPRAGHAALLALALLLGACQGDRPSAQPADAEPTPADGGGPGAPGTPTYRVEVVREYPHDRGAFTQGLEFHDGVLYESTGLEGQSSLRKVELETGRVLQRQVVPPPHFAEGITVLDGKLYQLTWKSGRGFIYDPQTLALRDSFSYAGEGWGLTNDGTQLILSDGSSRLRFLDPAGFRVTRTVEVTDGGLPVANLNELEYIDGEVWANVWQTEWIARIDPATGRVTGWVDVRGLLLPAERSGTEDVFNGIAYDRANQRLVVTGKFWPKLVEIRVRVPGG